MEMLILTLLVLCLIVLVAMFLRSNAQQAQQLTTSHLEEALQRSFKENRMEMAEQFRLNREEISGGLERIVRQLNESLNGLTERLNTNAADNREEMKKALKEFQEGFEKNVNAFNDRQRTNFAELTTKTEEKLENIRAMVDEKLHKTLEERLGQSFKLVSERLEAVQKGLGEMQSLANGVGDLKKVLTNVKTRGVLGEIQLGSILEQLLAPEQYASNVKTKSNSNDHVEFAIKLPGKDEDGKEVYLPIDAKFPQEDYIRLQDAYDNADIVLIDQANRALSNAIKKFAKDIRDKYVDPPNTTDFAILFLPIEGLFAEVVRQPDLVATLQREYKIIVTGPTTLAAMLNSLQMGFRTLAIQKRSSEVWTILGAVKTEFGKFGKVLEDAQKKINEANKHLDNLVGTRTRMMLSKLKRVEELPIDTSRQLLEDTNELNDELSDDEGLD